MVRTIWATRPLDSTSILPIAPTSSLRLDLGRTLMLEWRRCDRWTLHRLRSFDSGKRDSFAALIAPALEQERERDVVGIEKPELEPMHMRRAGG